MREKEEDSLWELQPHDHAYISRLKVNMYQTTFFFLSWVIVPMGLGALVKANPALAPLFLFAGSGCAAAVAYVQIIIASPSFVLCE